MNQTQATNTMKTQSKKTPFRLSNIKEGDIFRFYRTMAWYVFIDSFTENGKTKYHYMDDNNIKQTAPQDYPVFIK